MRNESSAGHGAGQPVLGGPGWAGSLDQMTSRGPLPPRPFCESMRACGRMPKCITAPLDLPWLIKVMDQHILGRGSWELLKVSLFQPGLSHADLRLLCGSNPAFLVGMHGVAAYWLPKPKKGLASFDSLVGDYAIGYVNKDYFWVFCFTLDCNLFPVRNNILLHMDCL